MKGTKFWHKDLMVGSMASIGDNCTIHAFVWIGDLAIIGNNCKIQAFSFIPNGVIIEDNVFIGPHVCFTNDKNPPSQGTGWEKTIVKTGAVIGAGAVILPGVVIGKESVVGAGSVVTKSIPDGETWVGNPASKLFIPSPRHHEDP